MWLEFASVILLILFIYHYIRYRMLVEKIEFYKDLVKYLRHIIDLREEELRDLRIKYGLLRKEHKIMYREKEK